MGRGNVPHRRDSHQQHLHRSKKKDNHNGDAHGEVDARGGDGAVGRVIAGFAAILAVPLDDFAGADGAVPEGIIRALDVAALTARTDQTRVHDHSLLPDSKFRSYRTALPRSGVEDSVLMRKLGDSEK